MPEAHHQPTTVSRAVLDAALDALGHTIGTGFGRARGFGHPAMPPGIGAAPAWGDPEPAFADSMKRHLDNVNRRVLDLGNALDMPDATLALAISDHLDALGLDDLTHTHN